MLRVRLLHRDADRQLRVLSLAIGVVVTAKMSGFAALRFHHARRPLRGRSNARRRRNGPRAQAACSTAPPVLGEAAGICTTAPAGKRYSEWIALHKLERVALSMKTHGTHHCGHCPQTANRSECSHLANASFSKFDTRYCTRVNRVRNGRRRRRKIAPSNIVRYRDWRVRPTGFTQRQHRASHCQDDESIARPERCENRSPETGQPRHLPGRFSPCDTT
jgi:hypothetical protein